AVRGRGVERRARLHRLCAGGRPAHVERRARGGDADHDARTEELRRARIARRHGVGVAAMTATDAAPPDRQPPRPLHARSPLRRAVRALSTVLIVAGLLMIADAGVTLAWQEPISAFIARIEQNALSGQLKRIERAAPTPVERRVAFLAREARRSARVGDPIGRIDIPTIGASFVVVQGTDTSSLRKGPGHYPQTTFPGLGGTVAIAGHRTTYLAPFHDVNELKRGDRIVLTMPYARFEYAVQRTQIVTPDALWIERDLGYERLVLSACHPLYSASHRIVVFARLRHVSARGAALRG